MKHLFFFLLLLIFSVMGCKRPSTLSFQKSASAEPSAKALEKSPEQSSVHLHKALSEEIKSTESNQVATKNDASTDKNKRLSIIHKPKPSEEKEPIVSEKPTASKAKSKKEMDPRLARSLWMTIFGGAAVIFGLIFINVLPVGLFLFAFGILFLVGIISLIMYLANPKPKM